MRIIQTNNIHTGNSTFINSRGSEREREKERELNYIERLGTQRERKRESERDMERMRGGERVSE